MRNALSTVKYLEKEWGMVSARKFQTILDSKIEELLVHPEIGRVTTKNKSIRKLIITKHNVIYYRFLENEIYILTLFEIKINPKKNKYE